jgi:hypothetical protein
VDLPLLLPGGLSRTGIAVGDESQPLLVADYSSGQSPHAYLSYILIPASLYVPAPDGKMRYMVLADSMKRREVGDKVVAFAFQEQHGPAQPGSTIAIWEKDGLLALAVANGISERELEASVLQIA